jgi:hypothetical protein
MELNDGAFIQHLLANCLDYTLIHLLHLINLLYEFGYTKKSPAAAGPAATAASSSKPSEAPATAKAAASAPATGIAAPAQAAPYDVAEDKGPDVRAALAAYHTAAAFIAAP